MTYLASAAKMCGRRFFFFGMGRNQNWGSTNHGSPIIIGHIAHSWGIEILEMGQYQTTQIGSMKFPTYYSVHFWTVNYRSMRGVEWPQKVDRILHLKLYTLQVVLCSLRLCYV